MKVLLDIVIGTLFGICINLVSSFIGPYVDKRKRLVWSILVVLIVVTALRAYRSLSPDQSSNYSTPTNMLLPPISANSSVQIVNLSEGEKQTIQFGVAEVAIGVKTHILWSGMDYVGEDVEVTVSTPSQTKNENLHVGDCIIVKPFSVSLLDVQVRGSQRASFVITKLAPDADLPSCKVAPTPTMIQN